MSVDKGGMRYGIEVENTSRGPITDFRNDIKAAREDFRSFKRELSSGRIAIRNEADLRKLARASTDAARAARDQSKADRDSAVKMNQRSQAVRDANKAFDRKVRADNESARSAERNFATERRLASALRQRAQAEAAITKILEQRARSQNILAAAQSRNIKLTEDEQRKLGLLTAEQRRLYDAKKRLSDASAKFGNQDLLKINAETEALRRQAKVRQEALTEQILAAKGLSAKGSPVARPDAGVVTTKIKEFLGLSKAVKDSDNSANRAAFTFRRLFGIFAAFTAIRTAIQFFKLAVVEAIKYNAELEKAELGIAGILAASADLFDAQGKTTDDAQRFAIAQGIAAKQMALLRRDALLTTASVTEMTDAFQVGLASGLREGLDVNQVRIFTRQIQIAASAIGLAENQLGEEIRSLLTGTINPRNTRVATALGIRNEDIARAKEAGQLFEFLQQKFTAFNSVALKATQTLPGLFQRLKNVLREVLGQGVQPLTDDLKAALAGVIADLVKLDEHTGEVIVSPEAIELVRILGSSLKVVLAEALKFRDQFTFEEAKRGAQAFADILAVVVRFIGAVVRGGLEGIALVVGALHDLRNFLLNLVGIDIFADWQGIVRVAAKIAAATLTILVGWTALKLAGRVFQVALVGINATARIFSGTLKGILFTLRAMNTAVIALGGAASPLLATFLTLAITIGAVAFALDQLRNKPFFDISETKAINVVARKLIQSFAELLRMQGDTLPPNSAMRKMLEDQAKQLDAQDQILENEAKHAKSLGDVFEESGKKFKAMFSDASDEAQKLKDKLAGDAANDGIILKSSAALEDLQEKIHELTSEAREARDQALGAIGAIGLTGPIAQQAQAVADAEQRIRRQSLDLMRDRQQAAAAVFAIETQLNSEAQISEDQRAKLEAQRLALSTQIQFIDAAELKLKEAIYRIVAAQTLALAAQFNFEQANANASLRIEASHAARLRIFEQEHQLRALALEQAKQELELFRQERSVKDAEAKKDIEQIDKQLELTRARLTALQAIPAGDRKTEDKEALDVADRLVAKLEIERDLRIEQLALEQQINDEKERALANQEQIALLQSQDPIGTGIVEAFGEAFLEVADTFQTTLNLMRGAIQGFSQFISSSIVDAFDPTSDTDLKERFARFLQSLAESIIQTLVQLAITAAVLNAASGGLLGPLLQGFSGARGFNGGGAVGFHEGGRASRGRTHRHFARARGYAEGGSPVDRGLAGVPRPAGLHPRDTVPLWADPSEWIIRGPSVRKAGADAVDRFNRGMFDPSLFRAAVGLDSFSRRGPGSVRRGRGFVDGGPAAASTARRASEQVPSGQGQGLGITVVAPSEDHVERFLRGGKPALLRVLAEAGIRPTR
jgi:hypothetical protein